MKIKGKEIAVVVIGGASKGGTGWGITPSGQIIKIEDNNPIEVIAEVALLATRLTASDLKKQLEGVLGRAIAQLEA
jgi:hypothetical protein